GRLLLRRALIGDGHDPALLARIVIDAAGRPCLPAAVAFNISHSDGLVALVTSNDGPVGIDIERLRPLDPGDLGPALTDGDRRRIAAAPDPAA
ncbi:4'-phosphopantetheinyl transferase family protein, partial [Vibrio parahaemolyticus]